MTYKQWWDVRKHLYQAKLRLLHSSKAEAIRSADQELDKAIDKIEMLMPENKKAS